MLYYKRCFGTIQKGAGLPDWVQWTHHSEGKTHCEECLMRMVAGFWEEMRRPAHIIPTAIAH